MSQLGFRIPWDLNEGNSNASEGVALVVRQEQAGLEVSFLLPSPLYRLPAQAVVQSKGNSSYRQPSG